LAMIEQKHFPLVLFYRESPDGVPARGQVR
jgi:hypothetical protein